MVIGMRTGSHGVCIVRRRRSARVWLPLGRVGRVLLIRGTINRIGVRIHIVGMTGIRLEN